MQVTNRLGLPQALVDAVTNDTYSKGNADISVTTLVGKPLRAVILEQRHADKITEDVAERIWALYGQVAHGILERGNTENRMVEKRMFAVIDGITVSGQMDSFDFLGGCLTDYKFVTAHKFKGDQVPAEYEKQLNAYAHLLRANDFDVKKLEIVGLLRDHSKPLARRDATYPQLPVVRVDVPLWPREITAKWLTERVAAYKAAHDELPLCSNEERWCDGDKWAVMKEGRKTAVRVYDREEHAVEHVKESSLLRIDHRPGEPKRCAMYCAAAPFCTQFGGNGNGK